MTDIDWKAKYEELIVKFLQQGFDHRLTVRALEADARRYRWLRDENTDLDALAEANWSKGGGQVYHGEELDRAIDAAMEQKA